MAINEAAPPVIIGSDAAVVESMLGFGAENLRRCYQCGTCSVVCPRTPLEEAFPRKEMVWAQWGLKDKLLADADAWLCYQCNDCITHCPVDARPGDVMAATRDLQITEYAFPRFMAKVASQPRYLPLAFLVPVLVVVLLVVESVLRPHGWRFVLPEGKIFFEEFIGHTYIDVATISLLLLTFGFASVGLRRFWTAISANDPPRARQTKALPSLFAALKEILSHKGFDDCNTGHARYWSHLGVFYGFIFLVLATTGDFVYTVILPALGIDYRGGRLSLPIYDPVKIIGNLGGLALLIAATQMIYMRVRYRAVAGGAVYFDWFFIVLVYMTTATGFALQFLRFGDLRAAAYMTYLVHLVFIYALFFYLPFSKFSHVIYRTAATLHAKRIGREAGA